MPRLNISIVITFFLLHSLSISAQENEWKLRKSKDGIIVYTREDASTGNIAFKSSIAIETSFESLVIVFKDVDGFSNWMADTKESSVLKKISELEQIIYLEANVPFPLENRDLPIYQKITLTDTKVEISWIGEADYIPKKDGITRIEQAIGSWEFIQLPKNNVRVNYQFVANPGLKIPNWIINIFIVDGPFETLKNLNKYLGK